MTFVLSKFGRLEPSPSPVFYREMFMFIGLSVHPIPLRKLSGVARAWVWMMYLEKMLNTPLIYIYIYIYIYNDSIHSGRFLFIRRNCLFPSIINNYSTRLFHWRSLKYIHPRVAVHSLHFVPVLYK